MVVSNAKYQKKNAGVKNRAYILPQEPDLRIRHDREKQDREEKDATRNNNNVNRNYLDGLEE